MNDTVSSKPFLEASARHVLIRKLSVADRAILRAHYLRLDPDAMRMRFGGTLSEEAIGRQVELSLGLETSLAYAGFSPFLTAAIIHGCFVDGTLRAVAELCHSGQVFSRQGEAAFSVETAWRHQGIATELFRRTLRSARNRGLKTLLISCLAWNRPMRGLASKFKAELKIEDGGIVGTIISAAPSSFSVFEEWAQDSQARLIRIASALGHFGPGVARPA